jgi:hypothetical protein
MSSDTTDDPMLQASALLAGRYRVERRLGGGGMADVYLAEDTRLGRLVAGKILKPHYAEDAEFVERFRVEAQATALLSHPNIVAVYDRAADGPPWYIAMEYVPGETLRERIRRDGALAPESAARTALAVLAALQAAHERHVVHRDVTSSNVLVDPDGRVKVADFGIARIGVSGLTRTGTMLGTSSYLSPEQAQGRVADERSDLYSLGVVLFEMLAGRVPFVADSDVAVALKHISEPAPDPRTLRPDVPPALAAVVLKALAKDAAQRYQTAAEFAAGITAALPGAGPAGAGATRSATRATRGAPCDAGCSCGGRAGLHDGTHGVHGIRGPHVAARRRLPSGSGAGHPSGAGASHLGTAASSSAAADVDRHGARPGRDGGRRVGGVHLRGERRHPCARRGRSGRGEGCDEPAGRGSQADDPPAVQRQVRRGSRLATTAARRREGRGQDARGHLGEPRPAAYTGA